MMGSNVEKSITGNDHQSGRGADDFCNQHITGRSSGNDSARTKSQSRDGGWGWFCVLGSFLNHLIIGGIERSGGLLYLELEERFEGHSASEISWIFSLNTALRQSLGPVVGILCNRFSCRTVVIAGGILSAAGLALSAFPPVLPYMYFSFGTLTGVGFALAYAPSVVIVGLYFTKYRGKAVGIAVAGVGVGAFAIPPLTEALLSFYGYFGALLILAAFGLNLSVGGALFRPLKETLRKKEISDPSCRENTSIPGEDEKLMQSNPETTEDVAVETRAKPTEDIPRHHDDEANYQEDHVTHRRDNAEGRSCLRSFIKKYLDVTLLLDIPFLTFCIAMFLFSVAFQASLVFLPALAKERGIPKEQSAILLSVMGGVEAVSRVLAGVVFDRPKIVPIRLFLYNLDVAIIALVTFLCTMVWTFPAFLAIGACYGLVTGMYISQKSVVIVDLVGQKVLKSSFGLLIWFQGMGSLVGPPMAGALRDSYKRYEEAFYFGGSVTLIGASFMLFGNLLAWKRRRKSRNLSAADEC